ncbi:MAG: alpha/beta hydrolase [Synechococcus sp.]
MNLIRKSIFNLYRSFGVIGCTLLASLSVISSARSADEISVRYNAAQRAISVSDLETFVTTGEIPRSLQWYADRLTGEQQATLRAVLQQPFEIDTNVVTRFVNSPVGETLLQRLLGLFWGGPNEDALYKALRSSLVLAATDEGGLTVLNAIQKYPLTQVRIDLAVALAAAEGMKEIVLDYEKVFALIEQKGAEGLSADSPDDLSDDFRAPAEAGELNWEKREVSYSNPVRKAGVSLTANVYLPEGGDAPAPLVIISHGVASTRNTFAYLAEHLASHGFAVAVLEHPDTDAQRLQDFIGGSGKPPEPQMFIERPNDVTALLDTLEQNVAEDSDWQGRLQTDRVGIFGQSLGGYTALASGGAELDYGHSVNRCEDDLERILPFNASLFLQCRLEELPGVDGDLGDDRVIAVLAVNPVTSALLGPTGMSQLQVPTMIVAGSHDFMAPALDEQIVPFTWLETEDRYLMLQKNGTHFSFLPGENAVFQLPSQLMGPNYELAKPAIQWMATTFFEAHVNGSSGHEALLSELLLPSRTGDFQYALTRSLSEDEIDAAVRLTE